MTKEQADRGTKTLRNCVKPEVGKNILEQIVKGR